MLPIKSTQQLGSQTNACAGDHRVVQAHASIAQLVDVRNHHHSVLNRYAEDRDESNYRRNIPPTKQLNKGRARANLNSISLRYIL